MTDTPRQVFTSLGVAAGALTAYLAASLLGIVATGDAVAGAAIGALVATGLFLTHRKLTTGSLGAAPLSEQGRSVRLWGLVAATFLAAWFTGQVTAVWLGTVIHSPGWEANAAARAAAPAWLLALAMLVLAPLGEEALVRGIVFVRLRQHLPVLASAIASALLFAVLHGNVIQIAATVPIGILLALAHEASGRLWVVVAMHMVFNLMAVLIPAGAIAAIASLPVAVGGLVLTGIALVFIASLLEAPKVPAGTPDPA